MAGQGGAKAPDYAPRPPAGPGAMANRQDLSSGAGAQPGTAPITGAPTTPVTGTGGAYGQRQELQNLAAGAPMTAARGRGAGASAPRPSSNSGLPALGDEEPTLGPLSPMPNGITATYSPDDVRELEQLLPILHMMAAQPDASDGVRELFNLAGEVVLNNQDVGTAVPTPLGPAPDRMAEGF